MKNSDKINLVAAAVAAALGTSAAHALPPTVFCDGVNNVAPCATGTSGSIGGGTGYIFYAAGGSAQEAAAYYAITQQLSSVEVYSNVAGLSSNYLVVTGVSNGNVPAGLAAAPFAAGKDVAVIYKFNGGSYPNGVYPHEFGTGTGAYPTAGYGTLTFPTLAALATGVTTANATPSLSTPQYTYTIATGNIQTPDWGLSDEEPKVFAATHNVPSGFGIPATALLNNVVPDGIYNDVFAIAVPNNVYNGTGTFAGHAKTNFTRAELAAIFTKGITNWNQLFDDAGNRMNTQPMVVLDRGPGSGSKAAGNLYLLNYPSTNAEGGNLIPYINNTAITGHPTGDGTAWNGTFTSVDLAESSNAQIVTDLIAVQNAGGGAVAVLSAEFPPAQNQNGGTVTLYSFTKINGVGIDTGTAVTDNINSAHSAGATKYTNVILGSYDFVYQNSFNTRNGFLPTTYPSGVANADFTNALKFTFQQSGIAGAVNATSGVTGVLLDADTGISTQAAGVPLYSRNKNSFKPLQRKFDAASTPTIVFGSDAL